MSSSADDRPPGGAVGGDPAGLPPELASRVAGVTRLADVGAPVSRMADIHSVLVDVLRTVLDVVRAEKGTLVLYDADTDELSVVALIGLPADYAQAVGRLQRGEGAAGKALVTGRPVVVEDVRTDPIFERWRDLADRLGYRSLYVVPLVTLGDEVMGTIGAYWSQPHRPDARETRLVERFARQAADMVERARLHGEARMLVASEQRRAGQLRQLADTALGLASVDETGELLRMVTDAAREIVGSQRAGAWRLAQGEPMASYASAAPTLDGPAGTWPGTFVAHPLVDAVVTTNRPVRRPAGADLPGGYLGVPLVGRDGSNLGLIELTGKIDAPEFGADDEAILVQLAQMASAAIDRLDLIERDRQAREEAERLARRYRLLSEAGKQLSASLEISAALRAMARLVVPTIAEWCALDLLGDDGALDRVHVVATDPETGERMRPDPAVMPDGEGRYGATAALRTGESQLYPADGDPADGSRPDDAGLAELGAAGPRSGLVVPLRARGQLIGALTLLRFTGPAYTNDDLALVEELAARAAQAIDNASRYEFERDLAATLQRSLLPQALPVAAGINVASRYLPGASGTQVGGDWYDLIDLGQGRLAMVIGDVMGRGVAAATVMGQLRASVRAYALEGHEPVELLRRVDRVVQAIDESQLTTCIYAVYDASTRDLTLAAAGHLPPLVIDATGPRYLELEPGVPLGVGDESFGQTRVPLAPGSTVLLYTDGLVEGPDCPIGVGMARLLEAARDAPANADELCDHLLRALGRDGDHDDDTALLAVTLTSADRHDPHEPAELSLPLDPESAATARAFVARTLSRRGLMQYCDVAVLLASELVTNALRHARTEVRLRVATTPGRLRIEVVDGSGQVPLPRHAIPDQDESGRGMLLVAGLSDRWGTEPGFGGKCVWFELDT